MSLGFQFKKMLCVMMESGTVSFRTMYCDPEL
jgi:hypothetical protein